MCRADPEIANQEANVTRRLELGPLVVALGALLLLVSLFLNWYDGDITAWDAFEVWDLVLAALARVHARAGDGARGAGARARSRRPRCCSTPVRSTVIVASQIIDQPPAAAGQGREIGCWLALGAAALIMSSGRC